jgi:hypothetical protein
MDQERYQGWVPVFQSGTDYEADLVRDRLDDSGIPAVVLTHRDHAFNLTVGDMAAVRVLVPPERVDEALALLDSEPFSNEELTRIAMAADPDAPPAHDPDREAMLDSGIESIRFRKPEDDESDESGERDDES